MLLIPIVKLFNLNHTPNHEIDLTPYAKVFVDKSASLPLDKIRQNWKENTFISPDEVELEGKFKRGRYRYWLTCHIQNTHSIDTILFSFIFNTRFQKFSE